MKAEGQKTKRELSMVLSSKADASHVEAQVEAAKQKVTNAFVGLVILFSIFAIIRLIEYFFGTNILLLNLNVLRIG